MDLASRDLRRVLDELQPMFGLKDPNERQAAVHASLANHGFSDVGQLRETLGRLSRDQMALRIYDEVSSIMAGEAWFTFMNHGYAPAEHELSRFKALDGEDDKWRHQIFLYFHLLYAATEIGGYQALDECECLDVGSGRGGGLSAMKRYYHLRRAVGLDLNPLQTAFCIDRHRGVGLEFVEGNAMAMPFEDGTFHLVTNVESCHLYADIGRFLREVRRILKPGGLFLLADLSEPNFDLPSLEIGLLSSGMNLLAKQDITQQVQKACELDAERFEHVFGSAKAEFPRKIAEQKKELYKSDSAIYVTYVLRKES